MSAERMAGELRGSITHLHKAGGRGREEEAIALRLEAIANSLEAIASRLEAIAS